MSANSLRPANELATSLESEPGPILRLVTPVESGPRVRGERVRRMNRRARHEAERALDVLDGDFMQGVHDRGGQVIFVDDWDSLSEEESQSVVYGASVAVPVGLNAHEVPAETQEVVEAVAVDIRRGRLLAHLRYLDPLHARAVALHYGLGEEAEHSLRQVGVQMGVPTTTARRLVNEGTRELRSFFALADI